MLNNVSLMGRLTRDPELRQTKSGIPVANFTLACNRDFNTNGENEADFIDIVAWKKTGEFASKYFQKGQLVAVEGRIQTRKWADKDGNNRTAFEVVAERVHFAESKKPSQPEEQSTGTSSPEHGNSGSFADFGNFEDDDLPF